MSDQGLFSKLFGGQRDQSGARGLAPAAPSGYFTYEAPAPSFTKEEEVRAMDELLGKLTSMELPDAIDTIMLGPSDSDEVLPATGFARYAARLFSQVGATHIRQIAATNELSVIRLSGTGTFWIRLPYGELSADDLSCVLAAESAMNRLLFIKEVFEERADENSWSEENCFDADLGWMENIVLGVISMLKGMEQNPLLQLHGAQGARGGEWDVRTRFALAVEMLRLPFRLVYSFDCDAAAGLLRVDYTIPLAAWLPQHRYNSDTHQWTDMSELAAQYAAHYSIALGAVLAAAAFGASVGMQRVHVVGHPRDIEADKALSLTFNRLPFVAEVVPAIENRNPDWIQLLLERASVTDAELDRTLAARHLAPQSDTRLLPEHLRDQLFADTVSELEVVSDMPTDSWDGIHAAEQDREDSPLAAIAVLESIVAQGDEAVAELPLGSQALYCSDAVSRFLLPLVGEQDGVRFVRYSDTAFRARSMLCDLYNEINDPDLAIRQAQKCIELAPTSTIGFTDLVNALFLKKEYEQAIPYLEQALRLATNAPIVGFLYYRLAYALWQTERRETALACYVLSSFNGFARPEVIAQEVNELLSEMVTLSGGGHLAMPSADQARDIIHRDGIVVAPTQQVREQLASVLVALVDAGCFDIAAPIVRTLSSTVGYRDEMFVVASSLER